MIVLVTGGRTYGPGFNVWHALDDLHARTPISIVMHGACCEYGDSATLRGADKHAQEWAQNRCIPYLGVPAQWEKFGKPAGMERNRRMPTIMRPEMVVAFPGGNGTANMVKVAEELGIEVWKPYG